MPTSLDLTLTPTPDLIEELSKRYAAAVFTALDLDDEVCVYLHGSALLCSGLLTNAQNEILWVSLKGHQTDEP